MRYLTIIALLALTACSSTMPPAPAPANGGTGFYPGGNYPSSALAEGGNPDRGGGNGDSGPGN